MLTIKLLVLAYVISLIVMYVAARSAIKSRAWRLVFCTIGAILPFMIVCAVIEHLVKRKASRVEYNADFAAVEDAIETRRVSLFGGEPLCPSFGERWPMAYQSEVQKVVVWSDKATQRIRHLKHQWG